MNLSIKILVYSLFFFSICFSQNTVVQDLKQKISTSKNDTNKVNLIYQLTDYSFKKEKMSDSELVATAISGIELAKRLSFNKGIVRGSLRLSTIYRVMGKYKQSLQILENAEAICINNKDSCGLFDVYNSKGMALWVQGNLSSAADLFFKGLNIAEILNDNVRLSKAYNGIGNLYIEQKDCKKAVLFHLKALKIRLALKDSLPISHSYVNLGESYRNCEFYDSSIFYYSKALQIQIITRNKTGQAYSYNGIAYNCYNKGQFVSALSYFKRAKALIKVSDDVNEALNNYIGIGKAFLDLKEKDSALFYLKKAERISNEANDLNSQEMVYLELTNYYQSVKDLESAFKYNQLYSAIRDSINGKESVKKIASIEYNYQIMQDKKIQALQEEQTKIIHESELYQQRIIIYSFTVGFILILILTWFVYKNYKQKAESNKIITAQKEEVELKNELIEEKQKEILDSIHYAKRIQTTLLAHREFINEHLKENFVLFRPKDIVSGDFYWATKKDDLFYFAVCDSTGHGVPGAFMSLLSITFLNEAINERHILPPNEVFNYVRKKLIESVSRDGQRDGFDGILICYNTTTKKITYAAANNAPVIVSSQSFEELQSDRMPVGQGIKTNPFTLYELDLKPNQSLYLFTDGYADQFGGPKGKKFMYKRLNELLVSLSLKNMSEQEAELSKMFDNWKGELEQIDDVCIIGLKV